LGEIHPPDVQAFVNQFRGYSTSVLKHLRATLSCVFQTAMTWKYVPHNPATGLHLPRGKSVKRAVVLTPEQLRLVITNLEEPYKTMAMVMAGTAIRESELLALKWSDLDYMNRLIRVRRSVYCGVLDEQTKTEESQRDIPMCATVVRVLLDLQKGPYNRGEYVFMTECEKIPRPEGVQRRHFTPVAEKLGIPRFTWRSFRRTSATALHEQGVPLKVQREIMGHTNEETSLIYTEVQVKAKRRAMEQLEEFLFGSKSKAYRTQMDPSCDSNCNSSTLSDRF
jgi:integrase